MLAKHVPPSTPLFRRLASSLYFCTLSLFFSPKKNPKRPRGGTASGSGCVNHPASCLFVSLQEALQRRRDGGKSRSGWFHTSQSIGLRERFRAVFSSFLMVTESAASLRAPDPPLPPRQAANDISPPARGSTFNYRVSPCNTQVRGRWGEVGGTGASSCPCLENGGVKQAHWAWT